MCGERHAVGGIRSIGSFVGEGARVGPGGEVHVMMPCSKSCQSTDPVSIIVSMLVLCCSKSFNPCLCVCRYRAFVHINGHVFGDCCL